MERVVEWFSHRDAFHPRAGGAERTALELCSKLASRGYQTEIVSARWPGASPLESVGPLRIHRFPTVFGPHIAHFSRENIRPRTAIIVEDLAHVIPWRLFPNRGRRCIAYFRHLHGRTLGGQVPSVVATALEAIEQSYPRAYRDTRFVTESRSAAEDLVHLGVTAENIKVIAPGVDSRVFHPLPLSQNPTIVYFGGFRRYKRPYHFVDLVGLLVADGIRLTATMFGNGPELSRVVAYANRKGLGGVLRFPGRVSDEILSASVASAWVNVHCSTSEGWCLSALEAAACGVPTVGYEVPGLRDSVRQDFSGILVEDGELSEMNNAAKKILSAPDGWRKNCRSHAEAFSWDRCADQWSSLISKMLSQEQ